MDGIVVIAFESVSILDHGLSNWEDHILTKPGLLYEGHLKYVNAQLARFSSHSLHEIYPITFALA